LGSVCSFQATNPIPRREFPAPPATVEASTGCQHPRLKCFSTVLIRLRAYFPKNTQTTVTIVSFLLNAVWMELPIFQMKNCEIYESKTKMAGLQITKSPNLLHQDFQIAPASFNYSSPEGFLHNFANLPPPSPSKSLNPFYLPPSLFFSPRSERYLNLVVPDSKVERASPLPKRKCPFLWLRAPTSQAPHPHLNSFLTLPAQAFVMDRVPRLPFPIKRSPLLQVTCPQSCR
jgi:hypothetical protein